MPINTAYRWMLLLLLGFSYVLHSQTPVLHQFTRIDGLPSLEIYDIIQDQQGYIWIGTDKGLCRYDGTDFKMYKNQSQKGQSVSNFYIDAKGRLWAQNFSSQLFFIGGDSLHYFSPCNHLPPNTYITDYHVNAYQQVIISSSYGDCWYNKQTKTWVKFLTYKDIHRHWHGSINTDHQGQIWGVSGRTDLLSKIPSDSLTKETALIPFYFSPRCFCQDGNDTLCYNTVALFGNKERTLLMGTQKNKKPWDVFEYQSQQDTFTPLSKISQQLKDYGHIPIGKLIDTKNQLWLGTGGGGVLVFDLKEQEQLFQTPILQGKYVSSIIQDLEGNYWISTLKSGLFMLPNPNINYYQKDNSPIPDERINALAIKGQQLLVGTQNKYLLEIDSKQKRIVQQKQYSKLDFFEYLYWDSISNTLIHTSGAITAKGELTRLSAPFINIKRIIAYGQHYLIMNTGTHFIIGERPNAPPLQLDNFLPVKLSTITSNLPHIIPKAHLSILGPRIKTVHASHKKDKVWISTANGLSVYSPNHPPKTIEAGPNNKAIIGTAIVQTPDGKIWVGTAGDGLYTIKDYQIVRHYTPKDGLLSNFCSNLFVDGQQLWIGTDKGIQCFDPQKESWRNFDRSDGLLYDEIYAIRVIGQEVWAASTKGLINFNKNIPSQNPTTPPIYITHLQINERDTTIYPSYQLPYSQNTLKITFKGLSYKSSKNIRYKYRLKGLSDKWIYSDNYNNNALYQSLPHGTYTFEVACINEDGVQSKQVATIQFEIQPAYWQTWWFWSLILLASLGFVAAIVWWQFRIYKNKQDLLHQMNQLKMQALQTQMNPHFIFNVFSSIQELVFDEKNEQALRYIARFAKLIRFIFEKSNDLAIPVREEIKFIKLYLELERLRFEQKIDIQLDIAPELVDSENLVPPLLIQPIIENSFKHGLMHKEQDGILTIRLAPKNEGLQCLVRDNGVGRAKAQEYTQWKEKGMAKRSSGLSITQKRLEILSAETQQEALFKITDLFDDQKQAAGTQTDLWIPFVKNF